MIYAQLATLSNHIVQLEKDARLLGEKEADKKKAAQQALEQSKYSAAQEAVEQADYLAGLKEETLKEIADKEAKIKALTAQRFGSPSASTSASQQANATDDESPSERDDSDDEDYPPNRVGNMRGGKKRGRGSGWHHTEESKAKMSAAKKVGWARKRAALLLDLAGATEPPSPTGYNAGLPTGATPTSPTPTDVETAA